MKIDFNISEFIQDFSNNCSKTQVKYFEKGEIITTYLVNRNQICFLINGTADLIRYDFNGNKTIIGSFSTNDIFGEVFYPANTNNELFVQAKTDCEVIFFIYNDILTKCKSNCTFHKEFSQKLHILIVNQVVSLNTRIELLTKKNIRDKLLSYFNILSNKKLSKTFVLPYSLTDLADYLSVDRSAMMRELSHLKEEGFIIKKGKKITLLGE